MKKVRHHRIPNADCTSFVSPVNQNIPSLISMFWHILYVGYEVHFFYIDPLCDVFASGAKRQHMVHIRYKVLENKKKEGPLLLKMILKNLFSSSISITTFLLLSGILSAS